MSLYKNIESKLVVKKETKYEEKEGLEAKPQEEVPGKKQESIRMRVTTEVLTGKESEEYRAAVIGDEVGDPMKATSGPAIAVLMKQSCLIALIFGEFFASVAIFSL